MAKKKKKKKLNKKVVIILAVTGSLLLMGVALTVPKVRNKLFPKDPQAAAERAAKLAQAGDFKAADEAYDDAVRFSSNHPKGAEFCYQWGKFKLRWFREKGNEMSSSRRRELFSQVIGCLQTAMLRDKNFAKAQQLLCDLYWNMYRTPGSSVRPEELITQVDRLIELQPENHQAYYRRAVAKADMVETGTTSKTAKDALADFDRAIELDEHQISYWLGKVGFLSRLKYIEKARVDKTFKAGLDANPDSLQLRVEYAKYLYGKNFRDDALTQLKEAIKRGPNSTIGFRALGMFRRLDNRPVEAKDAYLKALAIDPTDFRVHRDLAVIYRNLRELPKAVAILRKGIKALNAPPASQPASAPVRFVKLNLTAGRAELNYLLANALLDELKTQTVDREAVFKEIESCLDTLRKLEAKPAICESLEGRLAYFRGKMDKALLHLEKAYKGFGQSLEPQTASLLINIYLSQNLPGKAEKILKRFLASGGQRHNISIRLLSAQLQMNYRNYPKALQYITEILEIDPQNATAKALQGTINVLTGRSLRLPAGITPGPKMASRIVNRAAAMWTDERRDEAIALLENLYERLPRDMAILSSLVTMYQATGQLDKATRILESAKAAYPKAAADIQFLQKMLAEKDPKKRLAMQLARTKQISDPLQRALAQANLYRMAGLREQYVRSLQAALKIKPDAPTVVNQLFRIAIEAKNWDEAEKLTAVVSKARPDDPQGKLYAAALAQAQGRIADAINLLNDVLKARPHLKQARVQLGLLLMSKKKFAQAEEAFSTVAAGDPGYAPAVIGMMRVTLLQGKQVEYEDWLRRAYRLAPRNQEVSERWLQEQERDTTDPKTIIARREKRLRSFPRDLQNRLRLAALYEHTEQLSKAEQMYRYIYEKMADRLMATRILQRFYSRTGRLSDADRIIQDLLKTTKDQVGAYVLYGQFLSPHKPDQAKSVFTKAIRLGPQDPRGHLAMARFLARRNPPDYTGAVAAMKSLIALDKGNLAFDKELIGYEISAKLYNDASSRLDKILAADAADAQALRLKSRLVLRRDNDLDKAIDLLGQAIAANPDDAPSLVLRARLYQAKGELSKAKEDLRRAKLIANSPQVVLELADVYVRMRESDSATRILNELLARQNNFVPAIRRLIGIYTAGKKWQTLEKLLANSRRLFPQSPNYLLAESNMWRLRGDESKELSALRSAVKVADGSPSTLQAYMASLLRLKKYDEALKASAAYVGKGKYGSWLNAMRGRALAGQGKDSEADEVFSKAVAGADGRMFIFVATQLKLSYGAGETVKKLKAWRRRKNDWLLQIILSNLYREESQGDKAVSVLQAALKMASDKRILADIHHRLGTAYQQAKRFADAEKAYLATIAAFPDYVASLNNLAYLYADDLSEPRKALKYAEKAARLRPNDANILDTYGWTLARLGQFAAAEKQLRLSLVQTETVPASRYHLGWVYEQQGRMLKAIKEYRLGKGMMAESKSDPLYGKITEALARVQAGLKAGSGS